MSAMTPHFFAPLSFCHHRTALRMGYPGRFAVGSG